MTVLHRGGNEEDAAYGRTMAAIRLVSDTPGGQGAGTARKAEERKEVHKGRRAFACAVAEGTED